MQVNAKIQESTYLYKMFFTNSRWHKLILVDGCVIS